MNSYEKIIRVMRDESARTNVTDLSVAVMTSPTECKVGSLALDEDDLQVSSVLQGNLKSGDEVILFRNKNKFVIIAKVVDM